MFAGSGEKFEMGGCRNVIDKGEAMLADEQFKIGGYIRVGTSDAPDDRSDFQVQVSV